MEAPHAFAILFGMLLIVLLPGTALSILAVLKYPSARAGATRARKTLATPVMLKVLQGGKRE